MRSNGVRVVALLVGSMVASGVLGGCAQNKKVMSDAEQESLALREQNASLESSMRERDVKIAELETALANCTTPVAPPVVSYAPAPAYTPPAPAYTPPAPAFRGDSDFVQGDNGELRATLAGNVLFDSGQATIKASAKKDLDRIAQKIKSNYRGATIRVEGHTDSDPIKRSKWGSNDALSQARADAVEKYLIGKGVSSNRLSSVGMGSSQPKGTKASSRRVEIVVMQ